MKLHTLIWFIALAGILSACHPAPPVSPEPGISKHLAQARSKHLRDIRYRLHLHLPESPDSALTGSVQLKFFLNSVRQDLVIDFRGQVHKVWKRADEPVDYRMENGHIIIPKKYLQLDENRFRIVFASQSPALHRHADFAYTLFVPDKASSVFPCFDQPDLKGRFQLNLITPEHWQAVSNGPLQGKQQQALTTTWQFGQTRPLSTYLFAFAAGKFAIASDTVNGRSVQAYYRPGEEPQQENLQRILALTHQSLNFMEDYTGQSYPFQKYDLVILPSFPYGGMEHAGATFYNENRLFLSPDAAPNKVLNRAGLIAHEVAHNWFGNYLSIPWFDEVWLKELFATFLSDKMLHELYPDAPHGLNFFWKHLPAAFRLDRTRAPLPISRQLPNLNETSRLYDAIIYHKAPVVMAQLEQTVGASAIQQAIQEYLAAYPYGNAGWPDFIRHLTPHTGYDAAAWSQQWLQQAGRPVVTWQYPAKEKPGYFAQHDATGQQQQWSMQLYPCTKLPGPHWRCDTLPLTADTLALPAASYWQQAQVTLPNASPHVYAHFAADSLQRKQLISHLRSLPDATARSWAWLMLYEAVLAGQMPPINFIMNVLPAIESEQEALLLEGILGFTEQLFWQFLSDDARQQAGHYLQGALWKRMQYVPTSADLKHTLFRYYRRLALGELATRRLQEVVQTEETLPGLTLSTADKEAVYLKLALLEPEKWAAHYQQAMKLNTDTFRREKLAFLRPALSPDTADRQAFMRKVLRQWPNYNENWVIDGWYYYYHPLHGHVMLSDLVTCLHPLPAIQEQANVFFMEDWLAAHFQFRYQAKERKKLEAFIQDANLSVHLKHKIWQQADLFIRAAHSREPIN